MSEENNTKNFTAADIEKYHNGLLSPKEMNELERAALDDPFLADALEGYGAVTVNRAVDLEYLDQKLKERVGEEKVVKMAPPFNVYRYLKAAAAVVLIAGGGLLTYQLAFNKPEDSIAAKQDSPAMEKKSGAVTPRSTPDSLNKIVITNGVGSTQRPKDSAIIVTFGTAASSANFYTPRTDTVQTNNATGDITQNQLDQIQKEDAVVKTSIPYPSNITGNASVPSNAAPVDINQNKSFRPLMNQATADRSRTQDKDVVTESRQSRKNESAIGVTSNDFYSSVPTKFAANNYFNGRIVDNGNNAVPFANVTNTRDNVGTYADANGYFTLISPDTSLNLRVRSVGFVSDTIQLLANKSINQVTLKEDKIPGVVLGERRKGEKPKPGDNIKIEEPEPADGWSNYGLYIANNLQVPEEIKKKDIPGEVTVSFEVNKQGQPVNIIVEKSLCKQCDEEAKRLILQGPKWKLKKNKNKRVTVIVPFEVNQ
jgi:TonB family protein